MKIIRCFIVLSMIFFQTSMASSSQDMAQISLTGKDITMHVAGQLKDDFFIYNRVRTLRDNFNDQNDFIRHKLNLDMLVQQGVQKFGIPASEGFVRLTNYVFWQNESQYMPLVIDELRLDGLNDTIAVKNIHVKTLVPLIFVEQAWFTLHFDAFTKICNEKPTSIKVGYFPYSVGRGVAMGCHNDMAVDYLGWAGKGGFSRYASMPPGILFSMQLYDNLVWDIYFNQWTETNSSLSDTTKHTKQNRLNGPRSARGKNQDRTTWATKLKYTCNNSDVGSLLAEPYALFVNAPEQTIEIESDAKAKIFTTGFMLDWKYNNVTVNVEIAGQLGYQQIFGLDRNQIQLTRSRSGGLSNSFSHVFLENAASFLDTSVQFKNGSTDTPPANASFDSTTHLQYLIDNPLVRQLESQGDKIGTNLGTKNGAAVEIFNANVFGNPRFRKPYRLEHRGFMALVDVMYDFDDQPFKIAAAAGYISGDNYPYNEEVSRTYKGFVPLRSRYEGMGVQSTLIFDRLLLPRPLNISNRTLYAFNNVKDLSNLQFVGLGLTWYPLEESKKLSVTTDVMFWWEVADLKKWDVKGKHSDPVIEKQLERLRNTLNGIPTLFSGWESQELASKNLGTEVDVKMLYKMLDHCSFFTKMAIFFPGQLYKDLKGQPNEITRRIDERGFERFESLGHQWALACIVGLNYKF